MKSVLAVLMLFAVALPAYALPNPVPEIDGSLAIQFLALTGGLAAFLKKKKR